MLVLLFDIMEFGIVGGYLSKLCVTLPHMSICAGVIRAVALQQIDHAPHAKASAEGDNEGLQSSDSGIEKCHISLHFSGVFPAIKRPPCLAAGYGTSGLVGANFTMLTSGQSVPK